MQLPFHLEGSPFHLLELLGKGGMGTLFVARNQRDDSVAALKLTPDGPNGARLADEGAILARLGHRNIVRPLASGEAFIDGSKHQYLALELIEGETLADVLHARVAKGLRPAMTPDAIAEACGWSLQLLDALATLHPLVVHRDIAPDNLMLCKNPPGLIKLIDFGIAKPVPGSKIPRRFIGTMAGFGVGKPARLPPEVFRGAEVHASMDVYGAGLLIWELFVGKPAFPLCDAAHAYARRDEQPVKLALRAHPSLGWFDAILNRAFEKDPKKRFPDAVEFRLALQHAIAKRSIETPPVPDVTDWQLVGPLPHYMAPDVNHAAARVTTLGLPAIERAVSAAARPNTQLRTPDERVVEAFIRALSGDVGATFDHLGSGFAHVKPNGARSDRREMERLLRSEPLKMVEMTLTSSCGIVGVFGRAMIGGGVVPIAWKMTVRDRKIIEWCCFQGPI